MAQFPQTVSNITGNDRDFILGELRAEDRRDILCRLDIRPLRYPELFRHHIVARHGVEAVEGAVQSFHLGIGDELVKVILAPVNQFFDCSKGGSYHNLLADSRNLERVAFRNLQERVGVLEVRVSHDGPDLSSSPEHTLTAIPVVHTLDDNVLKRGIDKAGTHLVRPVLNGLVFNFLKAGVPALFVNLADRYSH